ncbi:MAG: efflux RND transporter periplasmic adaptor subunit [Chloroflexi bacterium]|nr:efflux RND transporter periplasmic adaptor subunit [Chloroflexota bacterium]
MKKIKEFFKNLWGGIVRHKTIAIIVVIAIALVVYFVVRNITSQAEAAGALQTAAVERGTLTASIGATGNVRANQTAILTWQTSGTVETVNVEIGDEVQAGDVLASLSQASLSQNLILAQADLVTAERNLETLLASDTPRAQAQLALVNAQQNYDSVKYTLDSFLASNRGASSEAIQNARAQYTLAQNSLEQAQNFYNYVKDRPDDDPEKAQAYTALYNAQQSADRAQNTLNYFLLVPSGRDIDEARANLALAEAQLEDAQREWERLMDGPDPDDILAAQARVDAARASVDMAQISAPFDGTITDAAPIPGDQVAPGTTGFRVDDLSRLLVEVQVSEVDINTIQLGQPVIITFDAVLGQEYHGQVVEVAQAASVVSGVVNFNVTVELTDADEQVKPGMTAAVTITVQQLENVLLVPNRAVRLLEGKRYVFVLRGGLMERVEITLGASSDTVSEVIAGDLAEGAIIILNPPAELVQAGDRPGFFMP